AYVSTLQLNPGKIAKLVEPKRPVYGKLVFADLPELCFFRIELILNIPDQLFEHVLQRDNTNGTAEFVHHDREMGMSAQEQREQLLERHHLRDGDQFAFDPQEIGMRISHQRNQLFHVNQPNGVIEMASAKREAGMT